MIKKLIIFLVCFIFFISWTSAFEFDNVYRYDNNTKTARVLNAYGLGADIGVAKLLTPQNMEVHMGYQMVAMFELTAYQDYNDALKEFVFEDMNNKRKKINRDYDLKYLTYETIEVDDYDMVITSYLDNGSAVYSSKKIGTHKKQIEKWVKITPADLKKNDKLIIGVFTNVKRGDYVDWIPTIYGLQIKEWATWTEGLNTGLVAYWNFNESSGNLIDIHSHTYNGTLTGPTQGQTGIIGKSYDFDGSNDYVTLPSFGTNFDADYSISGWVQLDSKTADQTIFMPYDERNLRIAVTSTGNIWFNHWDGSHESNIYYSLSSYTLGTWIYIVGTRNVTHNCLYINGALSSCDGTATNYAAAGSGTNRIGAYGGTLQKYLNARVDEFAVWSRALTSAEVNYLYNSGAGVTYGIIANGSNQAPVVTNKAPSNGGYANYNTQPINYKCYVTDDTGVSNVSLYINGVLNETNTSGANATNYTFSKTIYPANNSWKCGVCDVNGSCTNSSTWYYRIKNTVPSITLGQPTAGKNISRGSALSFNSYINDSDSSLKNVSLYIDGVINTTNSSGTNPKAYNFTGFTYSTIGTHNWSIRACDIIGNCSISTTRTFYITDKYPRASLQSPSNNTVYQIISGAKQISFKCYASDDIAVKNVSLYINGVLNETSSAGINNTNYTFTKYVNPGIYNWSCKVYDTYNQLNQTSTRIVTVQLTTPTIKFLVPQNNTIMHNSITVILNVTIPDGVTQSKGVYLLYKNGTFIASNITNNKPGNSTFTFTKIPDNKYYTLGGELIVKYVNGTYGYFLTSPNITLYNYKPQVNLTSPADLYESLYNNATLICSSNTTTNRVELDSMELWTNVTGSWAVIKTLSGLSGQNASLEYNLTFSQPTIWNCRMCDNNSWCWWASSNRTVRKDINPPQINITSPLSRYGHLRGGEVLDLNWTVSDTNINQCWYSYPVVSSFENTTDLPLNWFDGVTTTKDNATAGNHTLLINFTDNYTNDKYLKTYAYTLGGSPFNFNTNLSSCSVSDNIVNITVVSNSSHYTWFYCDDTTLLFSTSNTLSEIVLKSYQKHYIDCNLNHTTFVFNLENRTIMFNATDIASNEGYESVTIENQLVNYTVLYQNQTLASSSPIFEILFNVYGNPDIEKQVSTVQLVYNGTINNMPFSYIGGTYYTSSDDIVVPDVTTFENVSFYYNITFNNSLSAITINYTQLISPVNIDNCSNYSTVLMNLSLLDEDDLNLINGTLYNTSIRIDIALKSTKNNEELFNYTAKFLKQSFAQICIDGDLNSTVYYLDANIVYGGDGYQEESYNIINYELTNETIGQEINLYDILDSRSQVFQIIYKDSSFNKVSNALVQIQRKYIDEGIFRTIEIPLSGQNGFALGSLVTNSEVYKFTIIKDGEVLDEFSNVKAFCQNPSIQDCVITLEGLSAQTYVPDFVSDDDFVSTIDYNKTSREVSVTFTKPSGGTSNVQVIVKKNDNFGTNTICSPSLTSSSGSLKCTLPSTIGNSSVEIKLLENNNQKGLAILNLAQDPKTLYGTSLVFLSLILFLTFVFIGMSDSPMVTMFMMIIGFIVLIAFNLVYSKTIIGYGAAILWFIISIILIIIKGGNRS